MKKILLILLLLMWSAIPALMSLGAPMWVFPLFVGAVIIFSLQTILYLKDLKSDKSKTIKIWALKNYLQTSIGRNPATVVEELISYTNYVLRQPGASTRPKFSIHADMLKAGTTPKQV